MKNLIPYLLVCGCGVFLLSQVCQPFARSFHKLNATLTLSIK